MGTVANWFGPALICPIRGCRSALGGLRFRGVNIGRVLIPLAALTALASPATADSAAEKVAHALSNFQQEVSRCIAFLTVVTRCVGGSHAQLSGDLDADKKALLELAFQTGSTLGMTTPAMISRIVMQQSEMETFIDHDCLNVPSLITRDAMRCNYLLSNSTAVLDGFFLREGIAAPPFH